MWMSEREIFNANTKLASYVLPAVFTLAMLALVGGTAWAAWANFTQAGWDANSAAWVQACGSILAILGAAWLARGERRQTRRWRREQGEEAAWAGRFVIAQAQYDAHITAFEMTQSTEHLDKTKLRGWRQRSANSALILQSMLAKVDHIHPSVVVMLCNAKVLVDDMDASLKRLAESGTDKIVTGDKVASYIIGAHLDLKDLLDQYDERLRGVRQALDEGDDMLPLKRWTKERPPSG